MAPEYKLYIGRHEFDTLEQLTHMATEHESVRQLVFPGRGLQTGIEPTPFEVPAYSLKEAMQKETHLFVHYRSRHFRVTPRDKGVMSTFRWHGDALLAGRSRRGNGNDSCCDAGPQAIRNCAEDKLT